MPIALAVVGILLTLMVAGIFQQQWGSRLRQLSIAQTEADLAIGSSNARLGMALQGQAVSPGDATLASSTLNYDSGMASLGAVDKESVYVDVEGISRPRTGTEASDLFGTMADVGGYDKAATTAKVHKVDRQDYPWITIADERPSSNRPEFRVFESRAYQTAMHSGFPFAALAPKGSVTLESVESWSNPTVMQMKDRASELAQDQYSGLPAWVGASNAVNIGKFRNGRVFLGGDNPQVKVSGGAVAYRGLPLAGKGGSYEAKVLGELSAALTPLRDRSLDKTGLIWGAFDVSNLIRLCRTGQFPNLLTLEQSLKFPFFAIPQIKNQGAWTELSFHVPYAPDQNLETIANSFSDASGVGDVIGKFSIATNEYNRLQKERETKAAELAAITDTDSQAYKDKKKELEDLDQSISKKKDEVDGLHGQLTQESENRKNAIRDGARILSALPETQEEEKAAGIKMSGWTGWSYIMIIVNNSEKFLDLIDTLIGAITDSDNFDIDNLLKLFVEEVRLVHLGSGRPAPERADQMFKQSGFDRQEFRIDKTWTVPRGRTFRIQHSMKIRGDLWVQKGACMVVDGNLTLEDPGGGSNPLLPRGKLILEEGGTLVVGGNLTLAGTTTQGSMTVAGPVGREHAITSAVLCGGQINMAHGTITGMSIDDLALGLEAEFPDVTGLSKALNTLMTDVIPNLSKILGPFERRACYFAKYQTNFIIPNIFPIPLPIPDPRKKNRMCLLFQGMSMGYTAHLNATLGDNLMTASDWWIVGHDVVPVVVKVDPFAIKDYAVTASNSIKNLVGDPDKLEDLLVSLSKDVLNHIITDVAKKFLISFIVDDVITHLLDGLVPGVGSLVMEAAGDEIETAITHLVDDVYGQIAEGVTGAFGLEENGSLKTLISKAREKIDSAVSDISLPESCGALVYGRSGITIGGGRTASGWFVSEGNINSSCLYTAGSMMSLNGSITAQKVLFNPYFTKASIYLPRDLRDDDIKGGENIDDLPGFWKGAAQYKYGNRMDSTITKDKALKIAPNTAWVTAQGWSQK